MIQPAPHPADPRIHRALHELEETIRSRFPNATFVVSRGEDPEGIYLDAIVDLDDPDVVMDLVVERVLELQIEEALPIHVVPLRTQEREARLRDAQHGAALLPG